MIPLESLPDAVVIIDQQGKIVRVNSHAEELFGYSRTEMTGKPIELLVPERFHGTHGRDRDDYLEAPHVRPMGKGTLAGRRKNGEEVPVEIMLSPGEDETVVAVVRDISSRRRLEQFRDEYLGYISHDLKNPLSVISLQARLLAAQVSGRGLADAEHSALVIAQSASFIEVLVRELLEMSYLESDQVDLHREAVELAPFVRSTLERTVSTSDSARLTLELQASPRASVDPVRIERVLVNFVQNALKYAPPGSPIVVRIEERGGLAYVSVVDCGAGLTAEESSFVFDKYRRAAGALKREGLGLGLYISRKIVEAHGGKIGVVSVPGRGATFYFGVPMTERAATRAPVTVAIQPADASVVSERLRGLKVLIVDDEPNAVSALVALLGEEGLVVQGVTSGEQALLAVEKFQPDVALLDVEMPGMSGLTLLGRLRGVLPKLQAVIMTGYLAHHAGIAEARQATGASYVNKPLDIDEVLRTLDHLFFGRRPPPRR